MTVSTASFAHSGTRIATCPDPKPTHGRLPNGGFAHLEPHPTTTGSPTDEMGPAEPPALAVRMCPEWDQPLGFVWCRRHPVLSPILLARRDAMDVRSGSLSPTHQVSEGGRDRPPAHPLSPDRVGGHVPPGTSSRALSRPQSSRLATSHSASPRSQRPNRDSFCNSPLSLPTCRRSGGHAARQTAGSISG